MPITHISCNRNSLLSRETNCNHEDFDKFASKSLDVCTGARWKLFCLQVQNVNKSRESWQQ